MVKRASGDWFYSFMMLYNEIPFAIVCSPKAEKEHIILLAKMTIYLD
jgi:hypothetical protein